MFNVVHCSTSQSDRQKELNSTSFMQTVLEEGQRVKQLRAKEIQLTAENPRIRDIEITTDISTELRAQKTERFLAEKRRQQIRENSQELRLLEVQLRAARVSKELTDQKHQLENQKVQNTLKRREEDKKQEAERLQNIQLCHAQELEEHRKKEKFRGVLLDQMADAYRRRSREYEEVLRDREEMKKLQRRIEEEHAIELKNLEQRKVMAKKEMEDFIRSQELLKLSIRAEKVGENERFLEVLRERDIEKERIKTEKAKDRHQREAMSEKIGKHLLEIQTEKRHREDLLLDLLVEERKTKEDFRFRKNLEKQFEDRFQIRMELERYRDDVLRYKAEHQKDEDERLRLEQMRIWAEQDEVEKMSQDCRRAKVKEHGRFIQAMIRERRTQRVKETAQKVHEYEWQKNNERKRDQAIEDERIRLLRNEPPELLRYLPAGVLRESDREFLALPPKRTT